MSVIFAHSDFVLCWVSRNCLGTGLRLGISPAARSFASFGVQ